MTFGPVTFGPVNFSPVTDRQKVVHMSTPRIRTGGLKNHRREGVTQKICEGERMTIKICSGLGVTDKNMQGGDLKCNSLFKMLGSAEKWGRGA